MDQSRIKIKSINHRGGNTIVRYTITCECGCEDIPHLNYWPSKNKLSETAIKNKIAKLNSTTKEK